MKTAIVTGASTGIGRAIAVELAKHDYHLLLLGRNESKLQATKQLIDENHGQSTIFLVDLLSNDAIKNVTNGIRLNYPSVDLIVNVAGIWHGENEVYANTEYAKFRDDVISETLQVGIVAPMLLVHALIEKMPQNSHIVNISGTFEDGAKGWLPYYVAKRALEDFTVGLAEDLNEQGIYVNCISPSDTNTESYAKFFPQYIPDAIEPEEIAQEVVSLSNGDKSVTGKVIKIKKGLPPTEAFHN